MDSVLNPDSQRAILLSNSSSTLYSALYLLNNTSKSALTVIVGDCIRVIVGGIVVGVCDGFAVGCIAVGILVGIVVRVGVGILVGVEVGVITGVAVSCRGVSFSVNVGISVILFWLGIGELNIGVTEEVMAKVSFFKLWLDFGGGCNRVRFCVGVGECMTLGLLVDSR